MKRRIAVAGVVLTIALLHVIVAWGTDAELYFSLDKNGENRVTKIDEGDSIWIVVVDPDEDIDCDVRDKIWTDIKVMDVKTGAHIVWKSYMTAAGDANDNLYDTADYRPYMGHSPGPTAGYLGEDYLEEVDNTAGVFVSKRPFQVGTRVDFGNDGRRHAHIVGPYAGAFGGAVQPTDFKWGGYLYADDPLDADTIGDDRVWVDRNQVFIDAMNPADAFPSPAVGADAYLPPGLNPSQNRDYMLGRFENMDTLTGLYVDQNDSSDVAVTMAKISDTEATIAWGREVYPDANEAAMVTVTDPDENLNCSEVELVPVFILVNPGSWNPQTPTSAVDFCMLKRYGGVIDINGSPPPNPRPFEWYNIYDSGLVVADVDLRANGSNQPNEAGTYYVDYPTQADGNVTWFDTACNTGVTRVMFYAQETGADTGVFQLNFNSILRDLGFKSLDVRDVLVAYYIDPNDQDDFKLATAYIEEKNHSKLRFTDHARNEESVFWIGRDPVYVEVTDANANADPCCPEKVVVHVCDPHEVDDAEYMILDELSSNSPVFFTNLGMRLTSVWEAIGIGEPGRNGGYSLLLDNWELEAFNEDSVYARYNDVVYAEAQLAQIGDSDTATAFPPRIREVRVDNDVSFHVFEVGDTQVFDGDQTTMYFLDRNGNRIDKYANSDCVFISVIDHDQDEDRLRRERISGAWDGAQNVPHGPVHFPDNREECGYIDDEEHIVNWLLGDTNIFEPFDGGAAADELAPGPSWPKIYVLNPRNGRWASMDLLETGVDTGEFVSVICIDLVDRYECVPTLGVLPGDTIIAAYQDPSNHSDVAWISIKVGIGGALPTGSTVSFVDAEGADVAAYIEGEPIYVKVVDASMAGAGTLPDALTIDGIDYDLQSVAGTSDMFMVGPLDLATSAGDTVTATYVDPGNASDTSSASVTIVAAEFSVERFFAGPSPFDTETQFGFVGTGMAESFAVTVYDLAGHPVWRADAQDVLSVPWDGRREDGVQLANGAYVYIIVATGSDKTFTEKGKVFINR